MSDNNGWQTEFRRVYDRGVAAWKAGRKSAAKMFDAGDTAFLATIGHTTQELFDFVDDGQRYGEPDFDTALAVAVLRRDYYLNVQQGRSTGRTAAMESLPSKATEADGIAWLPRIIAKARLKLVGEMPADLMYGCGGDRDFLRGVHMTQAGFLELVWRLGDDDQAIVNEVKKRHAA